MGIRKNALKSLGVYKNRSALPQGALLGACRGVESQVPRLPYYDVRSPSPGDSTAKLHPEASHGPATRPGTATGPGLGIIKNSYRLLRNFLGTCL